MESVRKKVYDVSERTTWKRDVENDSGDHR